MHSNLARRIDLSVPSNRQAVVVSGAFLVAAGLRAARRSGQADHGEAELLGAIRAGDPSLYGRLASLAGCCVAPDRHLELLRGANVLVGATAVFATWSLARELLPDDPQLAAPCAAVLALQPDLWRSTAAADPQPLKLLGATGNLMLASRIATRSTGRSPLLPDLIFTAVSVGGAALLDPALRSMLPLQALAIVYDARRDATWSTAARRLGPLLAAAGVVAALDLEGWIAAAPDTTAPVASRLWLALGLAGTALALWERTDERVRSRADDGSPLATEAVRTARSLVLGWTALHLLPLRSQGVWPVLAPLAVGAVAGVAALVRMVRRDRS